jgi:hypothetical protein
MRRIYMLPGYKAVTEALGSPSLDPPLPFATNGTKNRAGSLLPPLFFGNMRGGGGSKKFRTQNIYRKIICNMNPLCAENRLKRPWWVYEGSELEEDFEYQCAHDRGRPPSGSVGTRVVPNLT